MINGATPSQAGTTRDAGNQFSRSYACDDVVSICGSSDGGFFDPDVEGGAYLLAARRILEEAHFQLFIWIHRRIGGKGQPECVPFLPSEYTSRRADFRLVDMSAEPVADATLADFDPLQRARLRSIIANNPRSDKSLVGLNDEQLDGALSLTITRAGVRQPTLLGL